jgi:hypothetical protein
MNEKILNNAFETAGVESSSSETTVAEESSPQGSEARKPKALMYAEAVERFRALEKVVQEAEQFLFNERPPRSSEERILARLQERYGASLQEAEAFAQSRNPEGEQAHRMLGQFLEAQITILSLYFDALKAEEGEDEVPSELKMSNLIVEDNPWIGKLIKEDTVENLP